MLSWCLQAMKLCALDSGEDSRRYHTKSDEFLDKVQSQMARELVQKVSSYPKALRWSCAAVFKFH